MEHLSGMLVKDWKIRKVMVLLAFFETVVDDGISETIFGVLLAEFFSVRISVLTLFSTSIFCCLIP